MRHLTLSKRKSLDKILYVHKLEINFYSLACLIKFLNNLTRIRLKLVIGHFVSIDALIILITEEVDFFHKYRQNIIYCKPSVIIALFRYTKSIWRNAMIRKVTEFFEKSSGQNVRIGSNRRPSSELHLGIYFVLGRYTVQVQKQRSPSVSVRDRNRAIFTRRSRGTGSTINRRINE